MVFGSIGTRGRDSHYRERVSAKSPQPQPRTGAQAQWLGRGATPEARLAVREQRSAAATPKRARPISDYQCKNPRCQHRCSEKWVREFARLGANVICRGGYRRRYSATPRSNEPAVSSVRQKNGSISENTSSLKSAEPSAIDAALLQRGNVEHATRQCYDTGWARRR